jgi:tellurite resistance protein
MCKGGIDVIFVQVYVMVCAGVSVVSTWCPKKQKIRIVGVVWWCRVNDA